MRILMIIDILSRGGKERRFLELLKSLSHYPDISIEIVVLSDKIDYEEIYDLDYKLHTLSRRIKKDPTIWYRLWMICRDFKPNLIHSWELMTSLYSIPIAKLFGIKLINACIAEAPLKLTPLQKKIRAKVSFYFSDAIVANSLAGLDSFEPPKSKSHCIYNGFNPERLNSLVDKKDVMSKLRINGRMVVGMVGAFEQRKDYRTFLLAALEVLKNRGDVIFIAIGDGPDFEKLKTLVNGPYSDKIKFTGQQNDVESIINIFDIGVLSTYTEGISNAIMEYMALSKPVIATEGGGTKEIVVDGKTGFLVSQGSINEMVEKINYFLDNPEISNRMGNEGRSRIERNFSLTLMTQQFIQLYSKCLNNQPILN